MVYLVAVSLFWAFSFGLIKGVLTDVSSTFVSFIRVFLAFLVFLPFFKKRNLNFKKAFILFILGGIQYGFMYLAYIYAFAFLKAYEVALFTIFTPFFVALLAHFREQKINSLLWLAVILAIFGTGFVIYQEPPHSAFLKGFLILQLSNFSFAFGQIEYKIFMNKNKALKDFDVFALLYGGASFVCLPFLFFSGGFDTVFALSLKQIGVLIYLGILPSGLCFFLWNLGSRKVHSSSLAVFNNAKIPLAVLVSWLVFQEEVSYLKLFVGLFLLGISLLLTYQRGKKTQI